MPLTAPTAICWQHMIRLQLHSWHKLRKRDPISHLADNEEYQYTPRHTRCQLHAVPSSQSGHFSVRSCIAVPSHNRITTVPSKTIAKRFRIYVNYRNTNKLFDNTTSFLLVPRTVTHRTGKYNIEGRSVQAITITYSERVFVTLGIQHAMRMRHVSRGLPRSTIFSSHYLINSTISRKKKLNPKCGF